MAEKKNIPRSWYMDFLFIYVVDLIEVLDESFRLKPPNLRILNSVQIDLEKTHAIFHLKT